MPDQSRPDNEALETSPSLLMRACRKDAEAWRRIVQLYTPLVEHWCFQASLSKHDVDDVIQDVFLSVAKQLDKFRYDRPTDTFRGWLRVIVQRRVSDHFRRVSNRPVAAGGTTVLRRMHEHPDPFADDPDAESEEAGVAHRALDFIRPEFEPQTWEAFRLTAIEGKTPAEIGPALGMTSAAIRMAKSRVLSRLRRELDGLGPV